MEILDDRQKWLSRDFSGLISETEEDEIVETKYGRARVVPGFHVDDEGFVIPDSEEEEFADGSPIDDEDVDESAGFASDAEEDPQDEEPAPVELTFEEKLSALRYTVTNRPPLREMFRRMLVFCTEERSFNDLEAEIATYPEFKHCGLTQFSLIDQLYFSYGLEMLEYDEEGNPVTPEMKEGLTEDEADDLVWSYAMLTTEVGRALIEEMEPSKRISEVFKQVPLRHDTYVELLEFCGEQPRAYSEIYDLFHGRDVLKFSLNKVLPDMPIEPSALVSKMERAGALVWDDGWKLTREGRRYLQTLMEATQ